METALYTSTYNQTHIEIHSTAQNLVEVMEREVENCRHDRARIGECVQTQWKQKMEVTGVNGDSGKAAHINSHKLPLRNVRIKSRFLFWGCALRMLTPSCG